MKALVLFYSYCPENTRRIAKMIADKIGADMEEIQPATAYSLDDFVGVIQQGLKEARRRYMPALKPLTSDLEQYYTVILGAPVWHMHYAPVIKSLLHQYPMEGKTKYPFATNAGWLGSAIKEIERDCPKATVKPALNVVFHSDMQRLKEMRTSEQEIERWINAIC